MPPLLSGSRRLTRVRSRHNAMMTRRSAWASSAGGALGNGPDPLCIVGKRPAIPAMDLEFDVPAGRLDDVAEVSRAISLDDRHRGVRIPGPVRCAQQAAQSLLGERLRIG